MDDYNYAHFPPMGEKALQGAVLEDLAQGFQGFTPTGEKADKFERFFEAPNVGTIAPNFALEDLETGNVLQLKDLWKSGAVLMEFGSYS